MGGPSPPFCTPHNGVYERLVYYHDRDRAERERQAEQEPNGRDRCWDRLWNGCFAVFAEKPSTESKRANGQHAGCLTNYWLIITAREKKKKEKCASAMFVVCPSQNFASNPLCFIHASLNICHCALLLNALRLWCSCIGRGKNTFYSRYVRICTQTANASIQLYRQSEFN